MPGVRHIHTLQSLLGEQWPGPPQEDVSDSCNPHHSPFKCWLILFFRAVPFLLRHCFIFCDLYCFCRNSSVIFAVYRFSGSFILSSFSQPPIFFCRTPFPVCICCIASFLGSFFSFFPFPLGLWHALQVGSYRPHFARCAQRLPGVDRFHAGLAFIG